MVHSRSITAALIADGNHLFGTIRDAELPDGVVFRLDPASGHIMLLPTAAGNANEGVGDSPLLPFNRALFGTTPSTTTVNAGTVFKFVP